MTDYPALDALLALRQSFLAAHMLPPTLAICPRCTDAILNDLNGLFTPRPPDETPLTLTGSCVMGFTFTDGLEEVCMLHGVLAEESTHG
jgi:hypothetical protein